MPYGPDDWIAPHIRMADVACRCGRPDCTHRTLDEIIHPRSLALLRRVGEVLKDYPGRFRVTSGLRCPEHNKAVGGSRRSAHVHRVAIDIAPDGPARRLYDAVEAANFAGGLFLYPTKNFIHVDLHPNDMVRRGLHGSEQIETLGLRWRSDLDLILAWNLDEPIRPPAYIQAALERETTA